MPCEHKLATRNLLLDCCGHTCQPSPLSLCNFLEIDFEDVEIQSNYYS